MWLDLYTCNVQCTFLCFIFVGTNSVSLFYTNGCFDWFIDSASLYRNNSWHLNDSTHQGKILDNCMDHCCAALVPNQKCFHSPTKHRLFVYHSCVFGRGKEAYVFFLAENALSALNYWKIQISLNAQTYIPSFNLDPIEYYKQFI